MLFAVQFAAEASRCRSCLLHLSFPAPTARLDAAEANRDGPPTRRSGSQSRWATWDRMFALALAAGGIAIILLLCLVVRISFPHSRQAADLPVAESPATQKDKPAKQMEAPSSPNTDNSVDLAADDAFVFQPAEMLFPPNTQKPIAIVPVVAQKLPPPSGIQIGKVRPVPELVPFSMKRRQSRSEEELRKELLQMAEVGLPMSSPVVRGSFHQPPISVPGLRWRRGPDCQLGKEPAETLQCLSLQIRQILQQSPADCADCLRKKILASEDTWRRPEAIPTLVQMLQVENQPVRLVLVEALAGIDGQQATHALVARALYDLSPAVRQAAVKALQDRPVAEYRAALLAGLRYPWPAVADHAAEALATLNVQSAVPELMDMLVKPGPEKAQAKTALVQEVVRINHQRNCMLCHAPSFSPGDPVRGAVPGKNSGNSYSQGEIFVRADVTYLQQDFSVMQPATQAGAGPAFQRFDYVIRSRKPTPREVPLPQSLQQRAAILFALQELTSKQGGPLRLLQALLRDEESRLHQAEIDYWKTQAEQLAQEKATAEKDSESQAPIPVTPEKPRFNVESIPWPVVFKEDRRLGSRVRVLAQFLERLDNNLGSQELVWTIKEALQALEGLRAGLDRYPITHLHANEARNFLDGIETSLWTLKRFI